MAIKNRKKFVALLSVVLILAVGVASVVYLGMRQQAESEKMTHAGKTVHRMSASWVKGYYSVEELVDDSDFIGLVEVTGLSGSDQITVAGEDRGHDLPMTIFSARVLDGVVSDEETLDIIMTGEYGENIVFEITSDPLLEPGEKWFIFA